MRLSKQAGRDLSGHERLLRGIFCQLARSTAELSSFPCLLLRIMLEQSAQPADRRAGQASIRPTAARSERRPLKLALRHKGDIG